MTPRGLRALADALDATRPDDGTLARLETPRTTRNSRR